MAQVAFCYLDPDRLGGSIQPVIGGSGWEWTLVVAMTDSVSGQKLVEGNCRVQTADGDSLAQVGQKLANGVKTFCATKGFSSIAIVGLPQTAMIAPTN